MKTIILFFIMATMLLACNKSGTTIHVKKTEKRYELVAEYPARKTDKLIEVLKTSLKNQDTLLLSESINSGREITLPDGAVFYLRSNTGKLEIEMLLAKNNANGLRSFEELSEKIKTALQ